MNDRNIKISTKSRRNKWVFFNWRIKNQLSVKSTSRYFRVSFKVKNVNNFSNNWRAQRKWDRRRQDKFSKKSLALDAKTHWNSQETFPYFAITEKFLIAASMCDAKYINKFSNVQFSLCLFLYPFPTRTSSFWKTSCYFMQCFVIQYQSFVSMGNVGSNVEFTI